MSDRGNGSLKTQSSLCNRKLKRRYINEVSITHSDGLRHERERNDTYVKLGDVCKHRLLILSL